MNKEQKRLLTLLEQHKISYDEYIILQSALNPKHNKFFLILKFLLNPFQTIMEFKAIIVGLLIILSLSFVAWKLNIRFSGIIGIEYVSANKYQHFKQFGMFQNFIELICIWLLASLLFILTSKILGAKFCRIIDFFAVTAIPKFTYLVLLTTFLYLKLSAPDLFIKSDLKLEATNQFIDLFMTIFFLSTIVWQLVLYFNGYKEASGLTGGKLWVGFIVSIGFSEIILFVLLKDFSWVLNTWTWF
jgi:hypothetical protein